jgi:FHA domain-containing protein/pyridine nucleotide-disulfide oxidoreductase
MVIAAIGSEPVLDYLKETSIVYERGVKIDGFMRTNAPDIYAAGDVAEITSAVTGHTRTLEQWYPAIQQGRAAAYSMLDMLDTSRLFHPDAGSGAYANAITSTFLYGFDFAAVGYTIIPKEGQGYQEIAVGPKPSIYCKALIKDGIAVGMFSLGVRNEALAFKRAIDHGVNLLPVASRLFANDFKLTDWLDEQKVPTPILAVSKERRTAKAKPLPPPPPPVTNVVKRQFLQHWPGLDQFNEQGKRNSQETSINPYILPIISGPRPAETNPTKAFLVPVVPPTIAAGEERAGKDTAPAHIAPPWAETPLSRTRILTVGRELDAMLFINHHAVSRRHAEITYANGHFLLRDLGSKNGTFLNDKRLEPHNMHILNPHDQVRFGTVMVYTLQVRPVNRTEEALP